MAKTEKEVAIVFSGRSGMNLQPRQKLKLSQKIFVESEKICNKDRK